MCVEIKQNGICDLLLVLFNMWSDSDDEVVPILHTIFEAIEEKDANSREWWVHPYNLKRNAEDVIINLIAELRTYPEKFNNFTRMRIETFDYLLGLIENAIRKQDTNYRKKFCFAKNNRSAIGNETCFSVLLWFLCFVSFGVCCAIRK